MQVRVVYRCPDEQHDVVITLTPGATVADAVAHLATDLEFAAFPLDEMQAGVFGTLVSKDAVLTDGDRLEFYRPLERDPKEARRQRASR